MIALLFSFFSLCMPVEAATSAHDFHVSKCIMEYSEEDQALQIMMHIYVDDLELALQALDETKLKLNTESEHEKADDILLKYLQSTFQVSINEEPMNYDYIGREPSEDLQALWVYLEIPNLINIQQIKVMDSLLTELYEDQTNIIQIKSQGGKKAFFLLTRDKSADAVNF